MIRSLVTGGAGFIGSHIIDKLINLNHEVICIDNEYADNEMFHWNKDAKNYKLDILEIESIKDLFKNVDYVFHCAAESRIGPAIENPINATRINVIGTCNILQCARENNIKKVIYSSTSSGYGNNECPNVETQIDDCLNPYSVSKIAGEKLCKMYSELFELPTIIFRYFNVYGERAPQKGQYCPVIGIFLRQNKADQKLTIVGDGSQRRDFVYVGDVADANIIAAIKDIDSKYYGTNFNIGSGYNISIREIANFISQDQVFIPKRKGEVQQNLANIKKSINVLGWKPKVSVEEWVKSQNLLT